MVRDLYTKAMLAVVVAALLSVFSVYHLAIVPAGAIDRNGLSNLTGHPIIEVWRR
jgi:hypothetical protein